MIATLRIAVLSLFALLLSAGLIGCAIFSQSAGAAAPGVAETGQDAHSHHHHVGMAHQTDDSAPMGHHQDGDPSSCDSCTQTVASRSIAAPDKSDTGSSFPLPVFVIPVTLSLEAAAFTPESEDWPPGLDPPLRPSTLTHQKISLLI
ncbi:MAG: hypothetical protein RLN72_09935 [Henriciella sp.]